MKLSIIIPARDEEASIADTVTNLFEVLRRENIEHEILVVDDGSKDRTRKTVDGLGRLIPTLRLLINTGEHGFGRAIEYGLGHFSGDAVAIMMADASDSPEDLVRFYREMVRGGYGAVFGSRFAKKGMVRNYPKGKLRVNRIANHIIKLVFFVPYDDMTNAFKLYSKETIEKLRPITSRDFELTLELPLKAILRGTDYAVVSNTWTGRSKGESKFKLSKIAAKYIRVVAKSLAEKHFGIKQ